MRRINSAQSCSSFVKLFTAELSVLPSVGNEAVLVSIKLAEEFSVSSSEQLWLSDDVFNSVSTIGEGGAQWQHKGSTDEVCSGGGTELDECGVVVVNVGSSSSRPILF